MKMRVTGKNLNTMWGVGAAHSLYRKDGKWYHHLKEFPGALFDSQGYVIFKTQAEYRNNSYLQHGQDLHVPTGISSMPNYVKVLEEPIDAQTDP